MIILKFLSSAELLNVEPVIVNCFAISLSVLPIVELDSCKIYPSRGGLPKDGESEGITYLKRYTLSSSGLVSASLSKKDLDVAPLPLN